MAKPGSFCWHGQKDHSDHHLIQILLPHVLHSHRETLGPDGKLDLSHNAYITGVGGREMKCRGKATNMVSAIAFLLWVITEKVTGTTLL